ncbi:hypothetical protein Tco_0468723 [Tanacetum coccineum]
MQSSSNKEWLVQEGTALGKDLFKSVDGCQLTIYSKLYGYRLTMFHVQRVDMVINPPWNLPFLGAKGLTSPEQTATDWKLLLRDVAASFDSAVHRVHAVSFDAAVASIVSAACCAAAGYFVYCCCLLCSCCSSILLPQEDLSRNLELTESTPIVPADSSSNIPADCVSAGHVPADRDRICCLLFIDTMGTHDDKAGSSRSKCPRQHETVEEVLLPQVHHEFLLWERCSIDAKSTMGCDGEIDDMLRIRLREAVSDEEIFTSVAWIKAFNINEPIYAELCHEFYSTYEFDEFCIDDELQTKKIIKFRLGGRAYSLTLLEFARRLGLYQAVELEEEGFNVYFEGGRLGMISLGDCKMNEEERSWNSKRSQICYGQFISKIARKCRVLTENVVRSLSALIYCRDLDTITLRDSIDYEGKLIPEDPQPGVPKVGIPRPPRASMQDLYDRMSRMEIRQEAIERIEYRQSYH